MPLAPALSAFCDLLRAGTGVEVGLGGPDEGRPGLCVWPLRLQENAASRSMAPRPNPDGTLTRPEPALEVLVLILPPLALSVEGLASLDAARRVLHEQPILEIGGRRISLLLTHLSLEELSAAFSTAARPLSPCLCVTLRIPGQA